jgi:elongation factor Tu
MEIRDLLTKYGFLDKSPIIKGSSKLALAGDPKGEDAIQQLLDAIDAFVRNLSEKLISHS